MTTGRFAPSPTGALHLGNLRTALLAWLFARSDAGRFLLRLEDLDPAVSRAEHYESQPADLSALGIDWDGPVLRQSERRDAHETAVRELVDRGLTYDCYCTRREVLEAAQAPHGASGEGGYAGVCRELSPIERRRREEAGRRAALRLRAESAVVIFDDVLHGSQSGVVDDFVLRRVDGVPAYNLAVVVDDGAQGVDQVVRADDLLHSTPRQIHLARLLALPVPRYAHVPLVLAPDGARLAKRHGSVTLADRAALGEPPSAVLARLAQSLDLAAPGEVVTPASLLDRFDPATVPREPWMLSETELSSRFSG